VKVVGYIRVSTDRQAEEGLGLEVQEAAIRNWANAEGHRVVVVARDEGVSGSLEDRPGLDDAFASLRERRADALVVYRLDRLARDLILQEQLLAEAWRLGAQVCSTMAGEAGYLSDDPDDPSRRFIRQVLGAVAEYERATIVMRLRSGRRRKAEKGGYAYGAPSFGLTAQNGALEPVEAEQAVLTRIRELRTSGASLRAISAHLEAEGLRAKRGVRWHPTTLARVIKRMEAAG
jgi:DNA invertase Pin-like site-specific DNA recombinase